MPFDSCGGAGEGGVLRFGCASAACTQKPRAQACRRILTQDDSRNRSRLRRCGSGGFPFWESGSRLLRFRSCLARNSAQYGRNRAPLAEVVCALMPFILPESGFPCWSPGSSSAVSFWCWPRSLSVPPSRSFTFGFRSKRKMPRRDRSRRGVRSKRTRTRNYRN